MVFLPVVPNWSASVRDTYTFLTEIHTSRNGREQRIALRDQPRRTLAFTALLYDGQGRRALEALTKARDGLAFMLDPTAMKLDVSGNVAVGSTSIVFSGDAPDWLEAGVNIAVYQGIQTEMCEVTNITGSTITVSSPLKFTYASGATITSVLPIVLRDKADFVAVTNETHTYELTVDVLPGTVLREPAELDPVEELDVLTPYAVDGVFYGRFVLLRKPNYVTAPRIQQALAHERVDYERGVIKTFRHVSYAQRLFSAQYMGRTYDDTLYLLDVFLRSRGQAGEIMMPSWGNDLPPILRLENDRTDMMFEGHDVFETYNEDISYRNLFIRLKDGRALPRQIVAMDDETAGETRFVLDASLPEGVDEDDIKSISWMFVTRFATDSMVIEWVTDRVAQLQMNFASLEALSVESLYGSNWVLKTGQWRDLGQWEDGAVWRDNP